MASRTLRQRVFPLTLLPAFLIQAIVFPSASVAHAQSPGLPIMPTGDAAGFTVPAAPARAASDLLLPGPTVSVPLPQVKQAQVVAQAAGKSGLIRRAWQWLLQKLGIATKNLAKPALVVGGGALVGAAATGYLGSMIQNAVFEVIAYIADLLSKLAGLLINFAGKILDIVLGIQKFADVPFVQTGWRFVRDVLNFLFLPAILTIAFATIAGIEGYGMRLLLPRLLMAALLVNFSLAIGGGIIAVSTAAMGSLTAEQSNLGTSIATRLYEIADLKEFYKDQPDALTAAVSDETGASQTRPPEAKQARPLETSQAELSRLRTQQGAQRAGIPPNFMPTPEPAPDPDATTKLMVANLLKLLILVVAAVVFASLAILFLFRVVVLLILLVLSPIGFVFPVLPGLAAIGARWWRTFLQYVFFGPAALALVILATHLGNFTQQVGIPTEPLAGGPTTNVLVNMMFQALIVILFLLAALWIGREMSILGASTALNFATRAATGSALLLSGAGPLWKRTGAPFLAARKKTQEELVREQRGGFFGRLGALTAAPFSPAARGKQRQREVNEAYQDIKNQNLDKNETLSRMRRGGVEGEGAARWALEKDFLETPDEFRTAIAATRPGTLGREDVQKRFETMKPTHALTGQAPGTPNVRQRLRAKAPEAVRAFRRVKDEDLGKVADELVDAIEAAADALVANRPQEVPIDLPVNRIVAISQRVPKAHPALDRYIQALRQTPQWTNTMQRQLRRQGVI